MMKRMIAFVLVLCLCACAGSSNPWERAAYSGQAHRAPSSLTAYPAKQAQGEEGQVYTPYTPGGYNAEIGTYQGMPDENAAPGQAGQPQSSQQSAFNAIIGEETGQNAGGVTNPQEEIVAAPSLPPVKVALLLPLSGDNADLGQGMLQAAQLALFDMGYNSFELMPRDTAGPQGASQAAQSAIRDGAQLILGPLFSTDVRAAKPVISRYNINMITFSTDWSLAGNNVYIMGFLPFAQVQRVSEYAAAHGLNDIGILAPNTDYGNAVIAAYNSLAYRTGLQTAQVVRFSPDETGESSAVLRSFTHYDERVQALAEHKLDLQSRLNLNPGDVEAQAELAKLDNVNTWGDPPFQAVLMPVGGEQARAVANLLSYYDLGPDQVKRLGTGLWDDPGLAAEPALDGAWFAASSPDLRKGFESRYQDLYGARPPRLASLAYDATALAAVLAKKSYLETGHASFDRDALVNPNGFAGIDGIFRFRPDGLIERGLAVLEFDHGAIKVIDPAPTTFQTLGY